MGASPVVTSDAEVVAVAGDRDGARGFPKEGLLLAGSVDSCVRISPVTYSVGPCPGLVH